MSIFVSSFSIAITLVHFVTRKILDFSPNFWLFSAPVCFGEAAILTVAAIPSQVLQ